MRNTTKLEQAMAQMNEHLDEIQVEINKLEEEPAVRQYKMVTRDKSRMLTELRQIERFMKMLD